MSEAPAWLNEEAGRAEQQAATGRTVNPKAKTAPKVVIKRKTKGFQVDDARARAWDELVARMKHHPTEKRSGSDLIAEAIDHILEKYSEA